MSGMPTLSDAGSLEQLSSEFLGFDHEEEAPDEDEAASQEQKPFDPEKIRVDQQMLSLKYIIDLMRGGALDISPDFQRKHVWKEVKRKSLLIESLILRIPIPAFYFYEDENAKFIVIDGQQRLATIREYMDGEFKLSGLEYLGDVCGGKKFGDLDEKFQQRINRAQMAVNILDARSPKKVIYDIFRRVNTGGIPLNQQEMRNAICSENVRTFLRTASRCEEFLAATRNKIKDERLDAQEMVLRFFACYNAYDCSEKKFDFSSHPNLASMLDEQIEKLAALSAQELENRLAIFKTAMERANALFGEYCFSKVYLNENNQVARNLDFINKSLFSSFSVILADDWFAQIDLSSYSEFALYQLAQALKDSDYMNAITTGTGDKRRIKDNFKFSSEVIDKCQMQ